jgi:hypothetical protein
MPTDDDLFPFVYVELLNYISFSIATSYKNTITNEEISSGGTTTRLYLPLACQLVTTAANIFAKGSASMRTKVFEDTAKVFGSAMMTKFSSYQFQLWNVAVDAFIRTTKLGLPDLNDSGTLIIFKYKVILFIDVTDLKANIIWTELADSVEAFVFHEDRKGIPRSSPEIVLRDENIDISLLDLLAKDMLASSARVNLSNSTALTFRGSIDASTDHRNPI